MFFVDSSKISIRRCLLRCYRRSISPKCPGQRSIVANWLYQRATITFTFCTMPAMGSRKLEIWLDISRALRASAGAVNLRTNWSRPVSIIPSECGTHKQWRALHGPSMKIKCNAPHFYQQVNFHNTNGKNCNWLDGDFMTLRISFCF